MVATATLCQPVAGPTAPLTLKWQSLPALGARPKGVSERGCYSNSCQPVAVPSASLTSLKRQSLPALGAMTPLTSTRVSSSCDLHC